MTIKKSTLCLSAACAILGSMQIIRAATWSATNPGNFLTASNWGGTTPNATGASALISTNPTSSGDFTLSGTQTLGTLDYNNSGFRSLTGGGTLNFNVSSGSALFHVRQSALDLRVDDVVLNDTTEFRMEGSQVIVSSLVSGSGGINFTGDGSLSLANNNNSYTGVTSISAGEFGGGIGGATIANNGTNSSFGRGNFAFNNAGFLDYNGPTASTNRTISLGTGVGLYGSGGIIIVDTSGTVLTLSGVISGGGDLQKYGPGTLQLSANNTYTGSTWVSEGTLRLGASDRISNSSSVNVYSPGTFALNNFNETIDLLSGDGNVSLGTGTLTVTGDNTIFGSDFSGVISGSGSLTKTGSGTFKLAGSNSYTGLTSITGGGTLSGNTIANNGTNSAFGRGNFALENSTLEYTGPTASTNRTFALNGFGGLIEVTNSAATLTLAGVLSGPGYFINNGPGTVQLNASNTYAGTTTVSGGGTLKLGGNEKIPDGSEMHVLLGATLNLNGFTETIAALEGNGHVVLGVGQLIVGANDDSTMFGGDISGAGSITKIGAGTLTLAGTSSHTGLNTISAGVLSGGTIANNGSNSAFGRGNFAIANYATLRYTGGNASSNRLIALSGGGGELDVTNVATTLTVSGVVSGTGGLFKVGAGTLELTGSNTYTGVNSVTAGKLSGSTIADNGFDSAFGHAGFALINAVVEYSGPSATTNRTVSLTGSSGGGIGVSNAATTLTLTGVVSGTADLVVHGPGTLQFNGANEYEGATRIASGTLRFGSSESIPNTSPVEVQAGGTLDVNGITETIGSLAGAGNVVMADGHLITGVNHSSSTFSGSVSGHGIFSKIGAGVLTLSGISSYTAWNNIGGGTLSGNTIANYGVDSAFGHSNFILANDATLRYTGSSAQTDRTIALNSGGGYIDVENATTTLVLAGVANGSGYLGKLGPGTLQLAADNSYESATWIAAGTLQLGGNERIPDGSDVYIAPGGALDVNNFSETIASLQGLGYVYLGSGHLTINADESWPAFKGNIFGSGSASLTVAGAGTVAFAGSSYYSGPTTVSSGKLLMNGTHLFGGDYTVASGATLGGKGTIGSNVNVEGTLAPGNSIGMLTVNGIYTQLDSAALEIEIGGISSGQFDVLNATVSAALAGSLDVTLTNDFTPAWGDSFLILSSAAVTGSFATAASELPALANGLTWQINYGPSNVSLNVVLGGDYNNDQVVDSADYVTWRKMVGTSGLNLIADGNGDTVVNSADYDIWRAAFGNAATSGFGVENAAAVPEHATLSLLFVSLILSSVGFRVRAADAVHMCLRTQDERVAIDGR